jgi:PIN domain nuclease of toxin-antitoxin system
MLIDAPDLLAAAREAIADSRHEKILSVASLWEITIKSSLGKLQLHRPLADTLVRLDESGMIHRLPIQTSHLLQLAVLPLYHRDPFDRMLVAQALSEGCVMISSDAAMNAYGVQRLW